MVGDPGSLGVVLGGSGNGEQIAANKVAGCRAALAWTPEIAALARKHNDAQVVSVGARMHSEHDAAAIVEANGLKQISDTGAIEAIIDGIVADNPDNVAQYRGGNQKVIGWFVGQVMKASQGKANPQAVNAMLKEKLGIE